MCKTVYSTIQMSSCDYFPLASVIVAAGNSCIVQRLSYLFIKNTISLFSLYLYLRE